MAGMFDFGSDGRIYYYDDGSNLREIKPDAPWSSLSVRPRTSGGWSQSLSFAVTTSTVGGALDVRVTHEIWRGSTIHAKCMTLVDHLVRGGSIALTGDHARTWGTRLTSVPAVNASLLALASGNLFSAYSASGTVAAGDHIVIQSPQPIPKREETVVQTYPTATSMTIAPTVVWTHKLATTLVRWAGFFPVLRLAPEGHDRDLLYSTDGRRQVWTLDLPLVTQPLEEEAAVEAQG